MWVHSLLRAKRSNPESCASGPGLLRRFAPRNDDAFSRRVQRPSFAGTTRKKAELDPVTGAGGGFRQPPNHAQLDLQWSMIFSENRYPLFRIMLNKTGRRDADRRVFLPSASIGMRSRAERSALACRRPTTALAAANERHRSAPRRSSWDAAKKRALPAPACPSPATWPQTGHSAGRTSARSRPGTQVTNLHPQEPLPLRQPA
jgi:hypothetical protein